MPTIPEIISEMLKWRADAFEGETEINGGDMVEQFSIWREQLKAALAEADDAERCSECDALLPEAGDGFDGLCAGCADIACAADPDDAADPWHIGDLPGDEDGRTIRDENGLTVRLSATSEGALAIVRHHNAIWPELEALSGEDLDRYNAMRGRPGRRKMSALETRKMLALSTEHVRPATWEWFDNTHLRDWPLVGGQTAYGFIFYVPANGHENDEVLERMPELSAALVFARKAGADYVYFDCDAEAIDDLPTYDETSGEER